MTGFCQNRPIDFIGFFADQAKTKAVDFIGFFADQKRPLVRSWSGGLVRLVRSGPLWSAPEQVSENKETTADQVWTKTGPSTLLVRSPGFLRSRGGGLNQKNRTSAKGCGHVV